jgi:hypothetical protein
MVVRLQSISPSIKRNYSMLLGTCHRSPVTVRRRRLMKKRLAALTYIVELTEEQFTHIIHRDSKNILGEGQDLDLLLNRIDGITDVDYSGHYGAVIIVSLDAEYDTPATWDSISATITKYETG